MTRPLARRLRQHHKANGYLLQEVSCLVAPSVLGAFLRFEAACVFFSAGGKGLFASAHGPSHGSTQILRGTSLTGKGHVLEPDETLFTNGTLLLVVSSNGCFRSPNFIRQLLQAERLGIVSIPIIVEDCFRFPQTHSFRNSVLSHPACRLGQGESLTTSSR